MAIIKGEDITLGYEGKEIVCNINFEINKGDYLCIVGENGAGKSTLMKTVLGLIEPVKGKITFGDGLKKNEIGYLPQQTVVQRDFPATIEEIVLSGCQGRMGLRPFYTKEQKERALSNMKRMGIASIKQESFRNLSGGQKQRVLLARALTATKEVLLLDEPVAGLDPQVTKEMYELINALNKEGITIIMISHDVEASVMYADKILHVGRHLFFGTKEAYLRSEQGKRFLSYNDTEVGA